MVFFFLVSSNGKQKSISEKRKRERERKWDKLCAYVLMWAFVCASVYIYENA